MNNANIPNKELVAVLIKIADKDSRKGVQSRAKIVLLAIQGIPVRDIACQVHCCVKTVYKWIKTWNKDGIGSLVTWRHPQSLKKAVKRRMMLEHLIQYTPENLRLEFTSWSLKTIQLFIKDYLNLNISTTTLYRDLRLLRAGYRKTKDTFRWKPVDYDLKRAQLTILRRYCPSTTRIVFIDEKGPVHALRYEGHQWSLFRTSRDVRQKSHGKVAFLGGYDPKTKTLEMFPLDDLKSTSFCQTLALIRMVFLTPDFNRLLLVLDNAPWHKSRQTLNYLANDRNIDYFFLPTYSPELNPIERCFGSYTRECLNNGTFISKDDVIERTTSYCHYFNTLRQEVHA